MRLGLLLFWACRPHLAAKLSSGLQCSIQRDRPLPSACSSRHNIRKVLGVWGKKPQNKTKWMLSLFFCHISYARIMPAPLFFLSSRCNFRRGNCHESCISQLSFFFRVKNLAGVLHTAVVHAAGGVGRGGGRSVATADFSDPNTSRQIMCLHNC